LAESQADGGGGMAGYWHSVFAGAWDKTYKPLGGDRKKAAVVLLAGGTIGVAGFHLGWAEMITTATGYIWVAAPAAFAAFILFIWGIFQTQADLYRELRKENDRLIKKYTGKTPNYIAVRLQHQYEIGDASLLWCNLAPSANSTVESRGWYAAFVSAIQQKKLKFVPKYTDDRGMIEYECTDPGWSTCDARRV
jgi:hypothetical protein